MDWLMKNRLYLHLMANKEKGFALPLAMLIGLILMVTGMTMMMRAQGDQSKVIAQNARADAFRSSEVGLARVQDLLNSVRVMATVDSNCTSGDNCWQKAKYDEVTKPTDLQRHLKKLVDAAPSCSNPNNADTLKAKIDELRGLSANQWFDLGNNRYYRVVGYDYSIGTGRGVLTLEGRRTSAAKDLTKTLPDIDSDDNAASRNRVVVTIPILDSPPLAFNRTTVPALWISDGTVDDGATFDGDVVEKVASPCNNEQDKIGKPTTDAPSPPYTAQFVGVFFPNLPPIPTDLPSVQKDLALTTSQTFPRTGDKFTPRTINGKSVEVYEYIVNNINLSGSDKITITPGNRVVFYVKGNINGAIEHDCGTTTACTGNLQIYAYAPASDDPQICLKGNQKLQAFIFAPDYSLGKTDDGTFIGAAWGKKWGPIPGCPSSSVAVAVTQTKGVEWTELIQDLKPKFPELGKIANWCEEPTNTDAGKSECD
jgi:hypothetical protein